MCHMAAWLFQAGQSCEGTSGSVTTVPGTGVDASAGEASARCRIAPQCHPPHVPP